MPRLQNLPLQLIKEAAALSRRIAGGGSPSEATASSRIGSVVGVETTNKNAPASDVASRERVGKYDARLVELVAARPGLTVAGAAAELGVHPSALYPIIKRLEARGQLTKRGRQLHASAEGLGAGWERLWCEAGHSWHRPTVRGRKPTRCPQHRRQQ